MLEEAIRLEKLIWPCSPNVGSRAAKPSQHSILKLENHSANSL